MKPSRFPTILFLLGAALPTLTQCHPPIPDPIASAAPAQAPDKPASDVARQAEGS